MISTYSSHQLQQFIAQENTILQECVNLLSQKTPLSEWSRDVLTAFLLAIQPGKATKRLLLLAICALIQDFPILIFPKTRPLFNVVVQNVSAQICRAWSNWEQAAIYNDEKPFVTMFDALSGIVHIPRRISPVIVIKHNQVEQFLGHVILRGIQIRANDGIQAFDQTGTAYNLVQCGVHLVSERSEGRLIPREGQGREFTHLVFPGRSLMTGIGLLGIHDPFVPLPGQTQERQAFLGGRLNLGGVTPARSAPPPQNTPAGVIRYGGLSPPRQ